MNALNSDINSTSSYLPFSILRASLWDAVNVYGTTTDDDMLTTRTPLSSPSVLDIISNDPILWRTMVINVEYNQLDPLRRATINLDGDVNCETGFSRCLGKWEYKSDGNKGEQETTMEGIVQFDLLQVMQRDYKLSSYSLNSVSAHFLGEQMFIIQLYRICTMEMRKLGDV
ncbi:hypothetical protein RND81_04G030500 [Saponaria officinalis]|uniref:DNA polymerase delta catalytic subunit n=1 Tax=Saponaria officinalis TaxID=3572 RepID=A0AAW1LEG7_SAPOF